jgi:hypothetical protein
MSSQPPLKCLNGRPVFEVSGWSYRWEDVFLWSMAGEEWERVLGRFGLTLTCAKAFRAAGRRIASDHVEEAANAFRYAHKLENAAAMRRWLNYWRLTPERWRQAILLQVVQSHMSQGQVTASPQAVQATDKLVIRWLRPLGAVSGAFRELAENLAGAAAVNNSLQEDMVPDLVSSGHGKEEDASKPSWDAVTVESVKASAATYLGLDAEELRGKWEHLWTIQQSTDRFRQQVVTPDAIRRQIASNPVAWTQIRYDALTFASAAAAREAADCIRFDGETPTDVAARAGIAMEQAVRFYTELERPLAAILLSAASNEWIGPLEIAGRHWLFRIFRKTAPHADEPMVADRVTAHLLTQAMEKERQGRVRWRFPF